MMTWQRWRTNCSPWRWSTRTWLIAVAVFILMSPLLTRWICLWQVPDVALNFDEEEFIQSVEPDVSDDQNAFVNYATAAKLLTRSGSRWAKEGLDATKLPNLIDAATQDPDAEWDASLTRWLGDNGDVLAEYRRGGDKPAARDSSLRTIDTTTILTVHNDLRELARLALLESSRHQREGNMEEAWLWHRANLRCAHHAETPPLFICRAVSAAIRHWAFHGVIHWAESTSLTGERLRQARQELALEVANRTPTSTIAKAEYLSSRNTLLRADMPMFLIPPSAGLGTRNASLLAVQRAGLWMFGVPEVPLRLFRQVLVNQRNQLDLPLHHRRKTLHTNNELVFEEPADGQRAWGQLGSAQLSRTLDTPMAKLLHRPNDYLGPHSAWGDMIVRRDDTRIATMMVVLAAQEFHRTQGAFPLTLEQLVPDYLNEVPFDPMAPTGKPLRYRRDPDGNACVWSIGLDETDDGGHLGDQTVGAKDMGFPIRQPRSHRKTIDQSASPTNAPETTPSK